MNTQTEDGSCDVIQKGSLEAVTEEAPKDRWMTLIESGAFLLTYLQAVEAETLPNDGAVVVHIDPERDDFGFPRVDLLCADRDQLLAYVREHWGDEEDPEWFQTYVVDRIEPIGGGA